MNKRSTAVPRFKHNRRTLSPLASMNALLRPVLFGLVLLAGIPASYAAPPEVPELRAWFALPHAVRQERAQRIRERLADASPAERQAFREELRERLRALPPEERRVVADRLQQEWREMSAAEREAQRAERRAYLGSLSREERRQLLDERRALLQRMSPEERRRWVQGMDR